MADLLIFGIIALLAAAAVTYIIKQKKKGVMCIGCPDGGTCSGSCSGACSSRCKGRTRS